MDRFTTGANPILDGLRRTKARLERVGWVAGWHGPMEGPNCLVGAVYYEADPAAYWPCLDALLAAAHRSRHASIGRWNAWPGRTVEQVLSLLNTAILQQGGS
jgi:hypothetical protein